MHTTSLVVALGLVGAIGSSIAPQEERQDLHQRVDALFADYDSTRTPGCSVGVVDDGELVHARGYGMASLDHGVPLGPRSVFRIASTSKQFTAFAIQLLVDRGEIDLDADVRTCLPELPEYPQPVSVRHLLNHTSGYRDYLSLQWLAGSRDDDYYTDAEVLDLLSRQRALNFQPGSRHLYSNSGYFLLGQIVLRVTGRTLREFAEDEIFGPLGMRQTDFHDDHREIVPGRAVGYSPTEGGGFRIDVTTLDMIGDGGVFTSVEDLAHWDANFYRPRVGTDATVARMLERGVLADGERIDYASGLVVSEHRGLRRVSHAGGFVGYRAELIRFPDQRLSVICLCNRSDARPTRLAQQVADLYLADHLVEPEGETDRAPSAMDAPLIDLPDSALEGFVGAYKSEDRLTPFRVERQEGGLAAVFTEELRAEIRPIAPDRFVGETAAGPLEIVFHGDGAIVSFGSEPPEPHERVELVVPSTESLAAIAGDYRCDELMTTVRLSVEGVDLRLEHENPHKRAPESPFTPSLADTFQSGGMVIAIDRGEEGEVKAIRLGEGRVRDIRCLPLQGGEQPGAPLGGPGRDEW